MTTITTGTSGPQAWKMILAGAAVGVAAIAIVNLPQTIGDRTNQQIAATATLPESATGFEYDNESTSGQTASPGVTTQYVGNSGELMPFENGLAPAQAPTGFGGPVPQVALDQARIDLLAPVISRVEPVPALGIPNTATNARWVALADAYRNATVSNLYTGDPDPAAGTQSNPSADAGTKARWEAMAEAYDSGSISSHYVPTEANPAD